MLSLSFCILRVHYECMHVLYARGTKTRVPGIVQNAGSKVLDLV